MLKIAICDDNKQTLELLSTIILDIFQENKFQAKLFTYLDSQSLLSHFERELFDVAFLDIQLSVDDDKDKGGFATAKQIRRKSVRTYIIFVTSHNELIRDSFDYQPFHFVVKGTETELKAQLRDISEGLFEYLRQQQTITIHLSFGESVNTEIANILQIPSEKNYCIYHITNGKQLRVKQRFCDAEAEFASYCFAKTHKQHLVNMYRIKAVDFPNLCVIISTGERIPISERLRKDFENNYRMFLRTTK